MSMLERRKAVSPTLVGLGAIVFLALGQGTAAKAESPEAEASTAPMPRAPVLDPLWHEIETGGETRCALGSEYRFFMRQGSVNKLVIEFQGGGACWDRHTCRTDPPGPYRNEVDTEEILETLEGDPVGFHDTANPHNPFRDWHHVLVPYCTGDSHFGDNVKVYDEDTTIHHKGRVNARAVLDWIFTQFDGLETIFVTGCSAGSFGSIAWAPYVIQQFPESEVFHLGDSFVGALTAETFEEAFTNWNAPEVFAKEIFDPRDFDTFDEDLGAEIYVRTAAFFPEHRFAQLNSSFDAVQAEFFRPGRLEDWPPQMRKLISQILEQRNNFSSYIAPDDQHCFINRDRFYSVEVAGTPLWQWIASMVDGRLPEPVDCESDSGLLPCGASDP